MFDDIVGTDCEKKRMAREMRSAFLRQDAGTLMDEISFHHLALTSLTD
jgi:hypothetical protein